MAIEVMVMALAGIVEGNTVTTFHEDQRFRKQEFEFPFCSHIMRDFVFF
jgi:hypothetical protein